MPFYHSTIDFVVSLQSRAVHTVGINILSALSGDFRGVVVVDEVAIEKVRGISMRQVGGQPFSR